MTKEQFEEFLKLLKAIEYDLNSIVQALAQLEFNSRKPERMIY